MHFASDFIYIFIYTSHLLLHITTNKEKYASIFHISSITISLFVFLRRKNYYRKWHGGKWFCKL